MAAPFRPPRRPLRLPRMRWLAAWLAIAAGIHLGLLIAASPLQSANDRSRWATVWALVERGTFQIDEINERDRWQTIDKVQLDGHLYSSKPALLPVLVAGVYGAGKLVTGWSILDQTELVTQTILILINLIPWIVAWIVVAAMAEKYAASRFTRSFVVATIACGTMLSTYIVTLNNHTIAATSLIFALFFATRIVIDDSRRWWDFVLCGLTAAFVTTNELPAALFGLALFGLLFWYCWRRTLFLFVPAALVPLIAFVVTTWLQTGGWKPFYLSYGTETYVYIRDGLPSYWAFPHGIDRNIDPPLTYLFHCVLGHHGILSLSPVFLLTVVCWGHMRLVRQSALRPFLLMGLGLTVVILGFYLSRTGNYNYSGNTVALRWMLWLVPFWILGLIPLLDRFADRRWFRLLAVCLLAVSAFSAWEAAGHPWRPSWLFRLMARAEWIDYDAPPPTLERPISTIISTLPPAGSDPETTWIELTAVTPKGSETIRLGLVSASEEQVTTSLTRTLSKPGEEPEVLESITAKWDRSAFAAGQMPAECLIAGSPSREQAIRCYQGLPEAVEMRPRLERFVKVPDVKYAFRTTRLTGTIDVDRPSGTTLRHRIDLWICPDVPFGVVHLLGTLRRAKSGTVLQRRDFTLSDMGRRQIPQWVHRIKSLAKEMP